ncbi:MAG: hypothetical protein K2O10_03175, partial [Muribaculaceae bacterium]|nr:hypothetical protein [Muribaculaceae bacterium]
LTFSIVRFPDETVVAENHTGTSFTETIPEPETHTRYHYTVAADNHGMKSFEQKSNFIALGSFEVPYLCDFASEDDFAEFTVITKAASPDNYYHWEYHTGLQAAHVGNGRVADDDILITPAIEFEGGKTYRVKITASNSNEASKARFMFKAGSTPTREGIDEYQLSDIKEFTSKRPQTIDIETLFTPAATGTYHVGIHSVAAAESYDDLFIHSIAIDPDRQDAISDTAAETVVISAIQGAACVKGAHRQPVTVYAPNGMTVFSTICDADTLVIPLRQGVYIVSAGTSAASIIVR